MTLLFSLEAKLISLRTLRDSIAAGLMNTRKSWQPVRAFPTSSGHSFPGSIPSSYQIRKRASASFLMTPKTSFMFLWE